MIRGARVLSTIGVGYSGYLPRWCVGRDVGGPRAVTRITECQLRHRHQQLRSIEQQRQVHGRADGENTATSPINIENNAGDILEHVRSLKEYSDQLSTLKHILLASDVESSVKSAAVEYLLPRLVRSAPPDPHRKFPDLLGLFDCGLQLHVDSRSKLGNLVTLVCVQSLQLGEAAVVDYWNLSSAWLLHIKSISVPNHTQLEIGFDWLVDNAALLGVRQCFAVLHLLPRKPLQTYENAQIRKLYRRLTEALKLPAERSSPLYVLDGLRAVEHVRIYDPDFLAALCQYHTGIVLAGRVMSLHQYSILLYIYSLYWHDATELFVAARRRIDSGDSPVQGARSLRVLVKLCWAFVVQGVMPPQLATRELTVQLEEWAANGGEIAAVQEACVELEQVLPLVGNVAWRQQLMVCIVAVARVEFEARTAHSKNTAAMHSAHIVFTGVKQHYRDVALGVTVANGGGYIGMAALVRGGVIVPWPSDFELDMCTAGREDMSKLPGTPVAVLCVPRSTLCDAEHGVTLGPFWRKTRLLARHGWQVRLLPEHIPAEVVAPLGMGFPVNIPGYVQRAVRGVIRAAKHHASPRGESNTDSENKSSETRQRSALLLW